MFLSMDILNKIRWKIVWLWSYVNYLEILFHVFQREMAPNSIFNYYRALDYLLTMIIILLKKFKSNEIIHNKKATQPSILGQQPYGKPQRIAGSWTPYLRTLFRCSTKWATVQSLFESICHWAMRISADILRLYTCFNHMRDIKEGVAIIVVKCCLYNSADNYIFSLIECVDYFIH